MVFPSESVTIRECKEFVVLKTSSYQDYVTNSEEDEHPELTVNHMQTSPQPQKSYQQPQQQDQPHLCKSKQNNKNRKLC
jgi:hypothetical protein